MKKVYKYKLAITDDQIVDLPASAKILHVENGDFYEISLWALVDPEESVDGRHIHIAGTGHPILDADQLSYVGTTFHPGNLVFHVFEEKVNERTNDF